MGLLPPELARRRGGRHSARRRESARRRAEARLRELRCTRMSMIFQEPMTALNPVMRCGDQIDEVLATHTQTERRRAPRRACAAIIRDVASARAGADDRVVSAPALRRPAPAHHDRDGAGAQARAADRRRADDRARRHDAGADPRADPASCSASTAPACCSSRTTSASSRRSPIASRCCARGELVEFGAGATSCSRTRSTSTRAC